MEYVMVDGNLVQKRWSKTISSMFLSDFIISLKSYGEQDSEKNLDELGLTVVSANGRVGARWFDIDGLEKFMKSRAFYESWEKGERLPIGLELYRLYGNKPIITAWTDVHKTVKEENKSLIGWRIEKLDASAEELFALGRELVRRDIANIVIETII